MNPPSLLWTKQIGTAESDYVSALCLDDASNLFFAGVTRGELVEGERHGKSDAFLGKLDKKGNLIWIHQIGTEKLDKVAKILVDESGNILLAGSTKGAFSEGETRGVNDVYLAKFDANGTLLWIRQMGTSKVEFNQVLDLDSKGNVYLGGYRHSLSGTESEGWLAKYNIEGQQVWKQGLYNEGIDWVNELAVDEMGNVYVAGSSSRGLESSTSKGETDVILVKLRPGGKRAWVKSIGSIEDEDVISLEIDRQAEVVILGSGKGNLAPESAFKFSGPFLAKLTKEGFFKWVRSPEGITLDHGHALTSDAEGAIYFVARSNLSLTSTPETKHSGHDFLLIKYDQEGKFAWRMDFGEMGKDRTLGLAANQLGSVYLGGFTRGEWETGANAGGGDAFIAKYGIG